MRRACVRNASLAMQMRPAVLRCVVVASSFSLLLGYDIGIMSGAKRLIRKDFALSDPQARGAACAHCHWQPGSLPRSPAVHVAPPLAG